VRSEDITADNTVLSSAIADAEIEYTGKGVITEKQRPGIVQRIMDWLWIF
jgi:flagellar L-ring protein precursor FlgH